MESCHYSPGRFFGIIILAVSWFCNDSFSAEQVRFHAPSDVANRRDSLISYIWGGAGMPTSRIPDIIELNIVDSLYLPLVSAQGNLARIDRYTFQQRHGIESYVYHFHPVVGNQELFLYHAGHTDGFRREDVWDNNSNNPPGLVIPALIKEGYAVLAFSMPLMGNNNPVVTLPDVGDIYFGSHWELFRWLDNPFTFFFDPVVIALNFVDDTYAYQRTSMVGLSGGAWTTTLYAALDTRIDRSYPVAGTMPLPYRVPPRDIGDIEQFENGLYALANYSELYVMGAFGSDRMQVQIMNRYDNCCFSGQQHVYWVDSIRTALDQLGQGGSYDFYLDELSWHRISPFALSAIFASRTSAIPAAPDVIWPNDGIAVPLDDTLDWHQPLWASTYRVQIALDTLFAHIIVDDMAIPSWNSQRHLDELRPGWEYSWRVLSLNDSGTSGWSTAKRFTTLFDDSVTHATLPDITILEDAGPMVFVSNIDEFFPSAGSLHPVEYVVNMNNPHIAVSFDGTHIIVEGDPDYAGSGILSIHAFTNLGLVASDTAVVTITPVNDPPLFHSTPTTRAYEDSLYAYVALALDPDSSEGDEVNYRLLTPQTWMTIDSTSGEISGILTRENMMDTLVVIEAYDLYGGIARQEYTILVTPRNHPPHFVSAREVTAFEDSLFVYYAIAADPDTLWLGQAVRYEALIVPSWIGYDSSSTRYAGISLEGMEDTLMVLLASDGELFDTLLVSIQVVAVNDPPRLAHIPDVQMSEDSAIAIDLSSWWSYVDDPDDADSTLLWTVTGQWITCRVQENYLRLEPHPDWFGTEELLVVVSDPHGSTDTTMVTATVLPVNDAPVLAPFPHVIFEEDSIATLHLREYVTDVDDDLSTLMWGATVVERVRARGRWQLTPAFSGEEARSSITLGNKSLVPTSALWVHSESEDSLLILINQNTHVVSFQGTLNFWAYDLLILLTVSDQSNGTDSDTMLLSITPINDGPTLTELPALIFHHLDSCVIPLRSWYPFLHDPDDPDSVHRWEIHGANALELEIREEAVHVTSRDGWIGSETLEVVAIDPGGLRASTLWNVRTIYDSLAYRIVSTPDTVATLGSEYHYSISLANPEKIASTSTISIQAPAWLSLDSTRTLHGTPPTAGSFLIKLIVSVGSIVADSQSFRLHVRVVKDVMEALAEVPRVHDLLQNFPNPFNPTSTLLFDLPEESHVSVTIFDVAGQELMRVVDGPMRPGRHRVILDATTFASGVYFYRMLAGTFSQTRKMVVLR